MRELRRWPSARCSAGLALGELRHLSIEERRRELHQPWADGPDQRALNALAGIDAGERRTVERRVFPGYILVQMRLDEDSWYVVRYTPGVTGFVGMGTEPTPLRAEEVKKIMNRMDSEQPVVKVNFKIGQKVRIVGGPFNDFIGSVAAIDTGKSKVRVMVDFFGRETPVELDFLEVEPT